MKTKLLITLAIGLLTMNLKVNAQEKDHNKSNKYMNKSKFDDLVERFDNPEREKWQKPGLVIEKLGDISDKTIGDIGSGTGYFSFRLAKKAKKVIALDVDERFLNFIKEKKKKDNISNVYTRLVEYDDPKLADNELDAIITVNTYHHINNRVEYFKKCKKGLSKNGILLIVDFKKEEMNFGPPLSHKLSKKAVIDELEKAGYKDISVDTKTLEHQYVIIAKVKK